MEKDNYFEEEAVNNTLTSVAESDTEDVQRKLDEARSDLEDWLGWEQ